MFINNSHQFKHHYSTNFMSTKLCHGRAPQIIHLFLNFLNHEIFTSVGQQTSEKPTSATPQFGCGLHLCESHAEVADGSAKSSRHGP